MSAEPALLFQTIYMAPGQEVQLSIPNIVKHHHFFPTFSQHPMLFSTGCRKRGLSPSYSPSALGGLSTQPMMSFLSCMHLALWPKAWENEGFSHFLHPPPPLLLLSLLFLILHFCWNFQVWLLQYWTNTTGFSPTVLFTLVQSWKLGWGVSYKGETYCPSQEVVQLIVNYDKVKDNENWTNFDTKWWDKSLTRTKRISSGWLGNRALV